LGFVDSSVVGSAAPGARRFTKAVIVVPNRNIKPRSARSVRDESTKCWVRKAKAANAKPTPAIPIPPAAAVMIQLVAGGWV
jgi:hypothetical protein